ncbi:RDD family protein [Vibrio sp. D404a]|uniref:RDD family protein n=1 Tax=unclassified Vibrio TaxID=2614977 RepID=UPI00255356F0|nr:MULTISPECIES: RDD family protein [unclassified Vibrio]MDK9738249.1 RDD family protein [Vibrio sp. D404a]MDK9796540.1 RDD family protein [Vibrio sp. D449a]
MLGQIEGTEVKIASRWSRFWAWLLDSLVAAAVMVPLFYFETTRNLMFYGEVSGSVTSFVLSGLLYFLCHGYLLHKYGQTIGKNVFEIAIVSVDNKPISLSKIFLMRWAPFYLMVYVPSILNEMMPGIGVLMLLALVALLLGLVNILFIFGKERRCLHDRLAGSIVVDVSKPKKFDFSQA